MIQQILHKEIEKALAELYSVSKNIIQFQSTRKDFDGDVTLVVFPFLRVSAKGVEETAKDIDSYLKKNVVEVINFNVVKGFLNIEISKDYSTEKSSFFINGVLDKYIKDLLENNSLIKEGRGLRE